MFSERIVPADEVHVFWSTQSDAGPADLDSCPSSHHPALPVILILGHYIFHHSPFHLPLRHLYHLVDLWPSHSTAITLHFASGLKQSVVFQLAASQQRLCPDMAENPSTSFQNGFVIQPARAMNYKFETKLSSPHTTVEELFSISINYLENINLFWSHS